jgi:hypothetical protein
MNQYFYLLKNCFFAIKMNWTLFTQIKTMISEIQTTFLTFFSPKKVVFVLLELLFKRMVVNKKAFWLCKLLKKVISEPNYSHFKIKACA